MTKKGPTREGFAIAALRRASYRWPAITIAMGRARLARGEYSCAVCDGVFGRREIQKDHIMPVVPVTGWDSFDGFIQRLYCGPEGMQVLCKPCHSAKTKEENRQRREHKKQLSGGEAIDRPKNKNKKFARK